jgi:hypothetical protein
MSLQQKLTLLSHRLFHLCRHGFWCCYKRCDGRLLSTRGRFWTASISMPYQRWIPCLAVVLQLNATFFAFHITHWLIKLIMHMVKTFLCLRLSFLRRNQNGIARGQPSIHLLGIHFHIFLTLIEMHHLTAHLPRKPEPGRACVKWQKLRLNPTRAVGSRRVRAKIFSSKPRYIYSRNYTCRSHIQFSIICVQWLFLVTSTGLECLCAYNRRSTECQV